MPGWQDLIVALAALAAFAWLFRRWLVKRRTRKGCDSCAAMVHSRISQRPAKANPEH
jgi:hypothetical protein